jgi:predicted GNAT superfamily acetyltransferase
LVATSTSLQPPHMPLEPNELSRPTTRGDHVAIVDGHLVTCRTFSSLEDTEACVALQREVWGEDFDHVPASLVQAMLHVGGVAIGAFDDSDGTLLGFVFGLPGTWQGELIHWSHMLAVRESARNLGIGRHLKELQRAELARRGIDHLMWTFDPLQARNAHLNLNRLGVHVVQYIENMYGVTRSPLHHGLATDRLIVSCATAIDQDRGPIEQSNGNLGGERPILTPFPRPGDTTLDHRARQPSMLLVEIPNDFLETVRASPDAAAIWRTATRRHFVDALRDGYRVSGLVRDRAAARAFYVMQLVPSSGGSALLERPSATLATAATPTTPSFPPPPLPPPPPPPHHRSDV